MEEGAAAKTVGVLAALAALAGASVEAAGEATLVAVALEEEDSEKEAETEYQVAVRAVGGGVRMEDNQVAVTLEEENGETEAAMVCPEAVAVAEATEGVEGAVEAVEATEMPRPAPLPPPAR